MSVKFCVEEGKSINGEFMKSELNWDVEVVPVAIPGKDYEEKLVRLVTALLDTLEKPGEQIEDTKSTEAA